MSGLGVGGLGLSNFDLNPELDRQKLMDEGKGIRLVKASKDCPSIPVFGRIQGRSDRQEDLARY